MIFLIASIALAPHESSQPHFLTIEDFESGSQSPAQFAKLSPQDQRQYLNDQISIGATIYDDPELSQMATEFVENEEFDPEADSGDFEIGENLYNNPDVTRNAQTVNRARKGFTKVRRAKGNKKFTMRGKVRKYDNTEAVLSTEKQEIKLDSFKDDSYGVIVTEEDQITIVDQFDREHQFEGQLDAFSNRPFAGKLLLLNKGSFDGHAVTDAAFRIGEKGINGNAKEFDSVTFQQNTEFYYREADASTIVPDRTKIESIKNAKLIGNHLFLPNNDFLFFGDITYTDGKVTQLGRYSDAIVDDIELLVENQPLEIRKATNDNLYDLKNEEELEIRKFALSPELLKLSDRKDVVFRNRNSLRTKRSQLSTKYYNLRRNAEQDASTLAKIQELEAQLDAIDKELANVNREFYSLDDQLNDFTIKRDEIQRKYRQLRNHEYEKIANNLPSEGNYFVYGDGRVWLQGSGFNSKFHDGNEVFPETNYNAQGNLEIKMQGGNLEMEKVTEDSRPLALTIDMEGKVEILNGLWSVKSDGTEMLARTEDHVGKTKVPVASDMRFNYQSTEGQKIYDLDISGSYILPLTDKVRISLQNDINFHTVEQKRIDEQILVIENNPQNKEKLSPLRKRLYDLGKSLTGEYKNYDHWRGQLRRATQFPHSNAATQQQRLNRINNKLEQINEKITNINTEQTNIKQHPLINQLSELNGHKRNNEYKLERATNRLERNQGETKYGVFGQVLQPTNGGSGITYQEYIQGFPVRKNTDTYNYEGEVYDPRIGYTRGAARRDVPRVFDTNEDKLILDVLRCQECIDTQFRLAYEFARKSGQNICYNRGAVCLRNSPNKRQFLHQWMVTQGTRSYESQAKSSTNQDIEVIPPEDYDGLRPGDVLLSHGHAVGIKEIVQIGDERFIRKFAGSMPAIDAHIYTGLEKISALKNDAKRGRIKAIYRWKFRGQARSEEEIDDLYKLSTQK